MIINIKIIALTAALALFASCADDEESLIVEMQETGLLDETIIHDNLQREYLLYIPESYTGTEPVPLVFSLHGAAGTKESQYDLSQFDVLADSENFILVTPEATAAFGSINAWNSQSDPDRADDVGFINALIDSLGNRFTIDTNRIYVAGSSNGGYMSYELACKLSNKVAAITSVKGAMFNAQMGNCNPSRAVPILEIHGTEDRNVPYAWALDTINFWVSQNGASSIPTITDFPDTNPNNDNSAQHYLYQAGSSGIGVEHIRVIGGVHDWFGEPGTNYDINASLEAWLFFDKFDINGLR